MLFFRSINLWCCVTFSSACTHITVLPLWPLLIHYWGLDTVLYMYLPVCFQTSVVCLFGKRRKWDTIILTKHDQTLPSQPSLVVRFDELDKDKRTVCKCLFDMNQNNCLPCRFGGMMTCNDKNKLHLVSLPSFWCDVSFKSNHKPLKRGVIQTAPLRQLYKINMKVIYKC